MIRMVGAIFLVFGAAALGACAARYLNRRVTDLSQLQIGLECMARELDYCLAPLPELLRRGEAESKGNAAIFFSLCAQGAEHLNGRTFQTVWQQALEAAQMRLESCDVELLEQLGGVLGRYDCDSQRRAIETAGKRLELLKGEAEEQSRRLGRMYSTLSLTAAGFLLILLI